LTPPDRRLRTSDPRPDHAGHVVQDLDRQALVSLSCRRLKDSLWAQLIKVRVKPGIDLSALTDVLKAVEQPESGLLLETFMHDQNDPDSI